MESEALITLQNMQPSLSVLIPTSCLDLEPNLESAPLINIPEAVPPTSNVDLSSLEHCHQPLIVENTTEYIDTSEKKKVLNGIEAFQPRGTKMVRKLTIQQRVFVLQKYWECKHDYKSIVEAFTEKYPDLHPPSRHTIRNLNLKFEHDGTVVDRPRSGRPATVTSDQKAEEVKKLLAESRRSGSDKSARMACKELGISKTSMLRLLKKVKNL